MERKAADQRHRQRTSLSQMAETGQKQQHQGHHQLTPLAPPPPGLFRRVGLAHQPARAQLRRKTSLLKCFQNTLKTLR